MLLATNKIKCSIYYYLKVFYRFPKKKKKKNLDLQLTLTPAEYYAYKMHKYHCDKPSVFPVKLFVCVAEGTSVYVCLCV